MGKGVDNTVRIHFVHGEWKAEPGWKPVAAGEEVVWLAYDCDDFQLYLPDIFQDQHPGAQCRLFRGKRSGIKREVKVCRITATVKDDVLPGPYSYAGFVDGDPVVGGSSPGVIVDP